MLRKFRSNQENEESLITNEQLPATLENCYDHDGSESSTSGDHNISASNTFTPATRCDFIQNKELSTDDLSNQIEVTYSESTIDHYKITYSTFYLLGIATMTPWNFFVTAEDYWMYKFRNVSNNGSNNFDQELTPMQKSFTCDLTLTASISGTTFLILNALYGHRVSANIKILTTLSVILACFFVTTAFVEVNTDHWQEQFFLLTLLTVVVINISSAVMSGGVFGVAGLFPSEYMAAVVSGQGLGGILTALIFIVILAFDAGPNTTAFIYFTIGSCLILVSILCFIIMFKKPFFKYYFDYGHNINIVCFDPVPSVSLEPDIYEVFRKIYVDAVAILLLFATTLSVYPSVSILMQSENFGKGNTWNDVYYMPVVNYLLFNTGDYIGRLLAGVFKKPLDNSHTILLLTFVRFLYVPFFLCSNTNLHNFLPVIVHSDTAFITMILTFGISNGYLANIILIMAPRSVAQHEKEMASSIMAASLSCGVAFGSILSMVFVQLL